MPTIMTTPDSISAPDETHKGPDAVLDRLRRLTQLLQHYGLMCVMCTLGNLGCLVVATFIFPLNRHSSNIPSYSYDRFDHGLFQTLAGFAGLASLAAISTLILFETRKKRGNALFDELSDEYQWNLLAPERKSTDADRGKPPIDVRVILREFSRASDLPLVPGKYGPSAYVGINVLIVIGFILWR